jgi:hypothetical protein
LHVLGLPPAFVLSQDQTLKLERFILDTNHSELTERHTRWRFRHRGGLLKKRTTPARVSATERPSPPKPSDVDLSPKTAFQQPARTPPPTFLFPLNTVKEQNRIRRWADLPKQHDGTDPGASLLLFQEVLQDKAAATTALSMDLI